MTITSRFSAARAGVRQELLLPVSCIILSMFFLVTSYGFIRPTAESLFIKTYGTRNIPYAMTAMALSLPLFIYLYGWTLSKLGAMKTLLCSLAVSTCVFLTCFIAIKAGNSSPVAVLYLFKDIYIAIIIEQYWSLINSVLTTGEAKVLNGIILGGYSLGNLVPSIVLYKYAEALGTRCFVLISACVLLPALYFSYKAYKMTGVPEPSGAEKDSGKGHLHLSLLLENHRLLTLAGIMLLSQATATTFNLKMLYTLQYSVPNMDARTAYLGGFWTICTIATVCVQWFAVPVILKFAKSKHVYAGVPLVSAIMCLVLVFFPNLTIATGALLIYKILDYSLFRASKELLYIPMTYDARYRAKQIIDVFMVRLAKGSTGGIMAALGLTALSPFIGTIYPVFGLACAACWTGLGIKLAGPQEKPEPAGAQ